MHRRLHRGSKVYVSFMSHITGSTQLYSCFVNVACCCLYAILCNPVCDNGHLYFVSIRRGLWDFERNFSWFLTYLYIHRVIKNNLASSDVTQHIIAYHFHNESFQFLRSSACAFNMRCSRHDSTVTTSQTERILTTFPWEFFFGIEIQKQTRNFFQRIMLVYYNSLTLPESVMKLFNNCQDEQTCPDKTNQLLLCTFLSNWLFPELSRFPEKLHATVDSARFVSS